MSEFDEPQTMSSSDLSKARSVLAVSLASRPYSSAVLWPTCQGPSISLPRHQSLTSSGSAQPCFAQIAPVAAGGMLQYSTKLRASSRPREPRLMASIGFVLAFLHQSTNSMDADLVGLRVWPGKVEARRALLARANPVFPIIGRDEIAAGIAANGSVEIADQIEDILAESVLDRPSGDGLIEAPVDRSAADAREINCKSL